MVKSRTLLFVLLLPALASSCQIKPDPTPAELRMELSKELRQIDSAEKRPPDFEARISRFMALEPSTVERVWAIAQQIDLKREGNQLEAIPQLLNELHPTLTVLLDEKLEREERDWGLNAAERALRLLHVEAYERWMGTGNDLMVNILTTTSQIYWHHFPDALDVAEVLWRDAEFKRQNGQPMQAVSSYELVINKDFYGKYESEARGRIIDAWTAASFGTPLPTDLKEEIPIPSPHKEWMAIVERTIRQDPTGEVARGYQLRIAQLKLAYLHTEDGEAQLLEMAFSQKDDTAVEAAKVLLQHAADTYDSKYKFRKLRKKLNKNKHLWGRSDFRSLYFELKEKVEGKR